VLCCVQYPEYYELIEDPIDLKEMNERLRQGDYYRSREMLYQDLLRMVLKPLQSNFDYCVPVLPLALFLV
jgi:hypothetical protein